MELLVILLVMAPVVILFAVGRNQQRRATLRSATTSVEVDNRGARRTLADGREEEVDWDEVQEVNVFTTRVGPHKPAGGAVVLYGDETRGCIIPLDRLGESNLLPHLTQLPGFDLKILLKAIGADAHKVPRTVQYRPDVRSAINPTGPLTRRPMQTTTMCWKRDEHERAAGSDP